MGGTMLSDLNFQKFTTNLNLNYVPHFENGICNGLILILDPRSQVHFQTLEVHFHFTYHKPKFLCMSIKEVQYTKILSTQKYLSFLGHYFCNTVICGFHEELVLSLYFNKIRMGVSCKASHTFPNILKGTASVHVKIY